MFGLCHASLLVVDSEIGGSGRPNERLGDLEVAPPGSPLSARWMGWPQLRDEGGSPHP
jgi:hypothetical protein